MVYKIPQAIVDLLARDLVQLDGIYASKCAVTNCAVLPINKIRPALRSRRTITNEERVGWGARLAYDLHRLEWVGMKGDNEVQMIAVFELAIANLRPKNKWGPIPRIINGFFQ